MPIRDIDRSGRKAARVTVFLLAVAVPIAMLPNIADVFQLPKWTLLAWGGIAIAASFAVRLVSGGGVQLPTRILGWPVAAFAIAAVVSTVFSLDPVISVVGDYQRYIGLVLYLSLALVFLAVIDAFDLRDVRRMAWCLIGAGGLVAAYGVVQGLGIDPVTWELLGLTTGFSTLGNPNFASAFAGSVTPLMLWAGLAHGPRTTAGASGYAILLLSLIHIWLTRSEQGLLVAAVGMTVVASVWATDRFGALATALSRRAVLTAAGLVGFLAAVFVVLNRLRTGGLGPRPYIYETVPAVFLDSPVTGIGFGTYGQVFLDHRAPTHAAIYGPTTTNTAHSVPLDMFTSGGLPLGLAYLAVVGAGIWILAKSRLGLRSSEPILFSAVAGSWVAYQLQSWISIDVPALALLNWLLLGMLAVLWGERTEHAFGFGGERSPRRRATAASPTVLGAVLVAGVAMWFASVPFRADARAAHGVALFREGRTDEAVRQLSEASSMAPWESTYPFLQANALERIGETEAAMAAVTEAAHREEASATYAQLVARFAVELQRSDLAAKWYREAAARDPHNATVLVEVADFLSQHGAVEEAVMLLERAREEHPDNQSVKDTLAAIRGGSSAP